MKAGETDDQYPPEEADRRRDEALRRALNMPPKPHEATKLGKPRRKNERAKYTERPTSGQQKGKQYQ